MNEGAVEIRKQWVGIGCHREEMLVFQAALLNLSTWPPPPHGHRLGDT